MAKIWQTLQRLWSYVALVAAKQPLVLRYGIPVIASLVVTGGGLTLVGLHTHHSPNNASTTHTLSTNTRKPSYPKTSATTLKTTAPPTTTQTQKGSGTSTAPSPTGTAATGSQGSSSGGGSSTSTGGSTSSGGGGGGSGTATTTTYVQPGTQGYRGS